MKVKTISSVEMKLKRHKLNFQYNEEENSLKLGGINVGMSQIYTIVLPIGFGVLLLALMGGGILPYMGKITLLIVGAPFVVGFYGLMSLMQLSSSNNGVKIFKPGLVEIIEQGGTKILINSNDIQNFSAEIIITESNDLQGSIYLHDKEGKSYKVLGLTDDNNQLLKNDLQYLKEYFEQLVGGV